MPLAKVHNCLFGYIFGMTEGGNMKITRAAILASTILALGIAGCTVEKTENGEAPKVDVDSSGGQMPKYKVVKTQEGQMPDVDVQTTAGKLPKYDVNMAKVEVNPTTRTINVPDVDVNMKKKQITVPDVNVTMPDNNNTTNP
jgi:hypothetical protein